MATTFRDRTNEFHSMCERIQNRTNTPTTILERRALLSSPEPSPSKTKKSPHARSEFSMMAAEISRQITNTAAKLEKLTRCKQNM
jgi:syntaxin 5